MDLIKNHHIFLSDLKDHTRELTLDNATDRVLAKSVAAAIKKLCGGEVIVCRGVVWFYSPVAKVWRQIPPGMLAGVVWEFDGVETHTGRILQLTASKVAGVVTTILQNMEISHPDYFDTRPCGVAYKDRFVVVDKSGAESRAHCAAWRCTEILPVTYDADAGCPKFLSFLGEVWRDDKDLEEKKESLRRFVGLCVVGRAVSFRTCALFIGGGANGKSLLTKIISHLFPREAVSCVPPSLWGGFRLAALDGKLINIVPELPVSRMVDTDVFKSVVAGDMVEADRKYRDPINFAPRAGHIFSTNELPQSEDMTDGFWDRFLMFTFSRRFTEAERRDPHEIEAEICEELPGILNWVVAGAHAALAENKLLKPPSHHNAIGDWRESVDQARAFFATRCIDGGNDSFVSKDFAYERYTVWADRNGHGVLSRGSFCRRFRKLARECRPGDGPGRQRGYAIQILSDNDQDIENEVFQ